MTLSRTWLTAAASEFGISLAAFIVIGSLAVFAVKRRNDPLRWPFVWMKWAAPFFLIHLVFRFSIRVAVLVDISRKPDQHDIIQIGSILGPAAFFFSSVSDCFILLCLVQLPLGLLQAFGKGGADRAIRGSTYVAFIILIMLTIITAAGAEQYSNKQLENSHLGDANPPTIGKLRATWTIPYWICSLPMAALAKAALTHSAQQNHLQFASRYQVVAVSLNLIRNTWNLFFAIKYNFNSNSVIPPWVYIVSPILYAWTTTAMFGVLVAVGLKRNGLWSPAQPQEVQVSNDHTGLHAPQDFENLGPGGVPGARLELLGTGEVETQTLK